MSKISVATRKYFPCASIAVSISSSSLSSKGILRRINGAKFFSSSLPKFSTSLSLSFNNSTYLFCISTIVFPLAAVNLPVRPNSSLIALLSSLSNLSLVSCCEPVLKVPSKSISYFKNSNNIIFKCFNKTNSEYCSNALVSLFTSALIVSEVATAAALALVPSSVNLLNALITSSKFYSSIFNQRK